MSVPGVMDYIYLYTTYILYYNRVHSPMQGSCTATAGLILAINVVVSELQYTWIALWPSQQTQRVSGRNCNCIVL